MQTELQDSPRAICCRGKLIICSVRTRQSGKQIFPLTVDSHTQKFIPESISRFTAQERNWNTITSSIPWQTHVRSHWNLMAWIPQRSTRVVLCSYLSATTRCVSRHL